MQINPESFTVTEKEIRQRFGLDDRDIVVDYGYEKQFDDIQKSSIQKNYDMSSLFVRTRPDFFITKGGSTYLVEAKQRTNTVEAVQLFFNQQLCQMGVDVIYSFPEFNIPAQFITIQEIFVPDKYRESFERFFKEQIRTLLPDVTFSYLPTTKGSGDPYIILDSDYLREISQTFS